MNNLGTESVDSDGRIWFALPYVAAFGAIEYPGKLVIQVHGSLSVSLT